jgi:hypothetical protein
MMEGHEERAEELEYELADMQEESDSLADDIYSAKSDWEQKKQDDSVPGAGTGEDDESPDSETTEGGGTPEVED